MPHDATSVTSAKPFKCFARELKRAFRCRMAHRSTKTIWSSKGSQRGLVRCSRQDRLRQSRMPMTHTKRFAQSQTTSTNRAGRRLDVGPLCQISRRTHPCSRPAPPAADGPTLAVAFASGYHAIRAYGFVTRPVLVCASGGTLRMGADQRSREPAEAWDLLREGPARLRGSQACDRGRPIPQLEGETPLLLRAGRRRSPDGSLHVPRGCDPNHRGRLLARRQADL